MLLAAYCFYSDGIHEVKSLESFYAKDPFSVDDRPYLYYHSKDVHTPFYTHGNLYNFLTALEFSKKAQELCCQF